MLFSGSAPGKIILSGEYAVLFGHRGLAVPSAIGMEVLYEPGTKADAWEIHWEGVAGDAAWDTYAGSIATLCAKQGGQQSGRLTIRNALSLGKGMGSSTALVIALARCLMGEDCEDQARCIEDEVNPGHSGLDFETIWQNQPTIFRKGAPTETALFDQALLQSTVLIDTGTPEQTTAELVADIQQRASALRTALDAIGACTERLLAGEPLRAVLREHHCAQVALGIVTAEAQELIKKIEQSGGSAKVLGAGSHTGGCGMVLCVDVETRTAQEIAHAQGYGMQAAQYDRTTTR